MKTFLFLIFNIHWLSVIAQTNALSFFSARIHPQGIQLDWELNAGNTCAGIIIYHGSDSVQLNAIASIDGVCGDPGFAVEYSFVDSTPVENAENYYRLELGGLGFSEVVSALYRVPIKDEYLIKYSEYYTEVVFRYENYHQAQFMVYDLNSRLLFDIFFSGNSVRIPTDKLAGSLGAFLVQQNGIPEVRGKLLLGRL